MTTASRPLATALCAGALRGRLAPATPPPGARPRSQPAALCRFRDHVIASVTAKDPDGGVDRQRRQFAELLHVRVALLAIARGLVLTCRIRRKLCVVRRH